MEFLSYDNGVIKHAFYRAENDSTGQSRITQRKKRRHQRDVVQAVAPSYTHNLLLPEETPFACTPSVVSFTNYDVGSQYTVTLAFLNTTTGPKTFRVMPVLPQYAGVLSFQYSVPPRIPPGLSWEVTLIFRPRDSVDFATSIYVKTEDGFFAVPVSSSRKAFVFSATPSRIDFGTVVVGEERTRKIKLQNSGALSGTVVIGGDFKALLEQKHTNPMNGKKVSFFRVSPQQYKLKIPPFSVSEVAINFAPLNAANIQTNISFTEKGNPEAAISVPISGNSTELPVYLTNGKTDFGVCFFDETYWEEVGVVNRTSITATAEFTVPASLTGVISISPPRICVPPGEQYNVRVTFIPSRKLSKVFSATVECAVRAQTLPLPLNISATLCDRAPRIALMTLDVGSIQLNTSREVQLPVTNEASIMQLVGFDVLPNWVTVFPEVLELVPNEAAHFALTVEPPQEGRFMQRLRLLNEFGDVQHVTVVGQGVKAPFDLSSRALLLPPCNIGSSIAATTVLSNKSNDPCDFSFSVPSACFRVSPDTGVLQPGESVALAVLFDAPLEYENVVVQQLSTSPKRAGKGKKDVPAAPLAETVVLQQKAMYDGWECGSDEKVWSRHRQFRLKCDLHGGCEESFFISVRCCAVKPPVCIEDVTPPSLTLAPKSAKENEAETRRSTRKSAHSVEDGDSHALEAKNQREIVVNFGKAPLHHVCVRSVRIRNGNSEPCQVCLPPFDPLSAFTVINYAVDGIKGQSDATFNVAFQPFKYGKFNEVIPLELRTADDGNKSHIFVRARGMCNPTQLSVTSTDFEAASPAVESADVQQRLAFHCTQRNDFARKAVVLSNIGAFPLSVAITCLPDGLQSDTAEDPTRPFLVNPRRFTVPANSKQAVEIVFAPGDEGVYAARLRIAASGETREIDLDGRCVKSAMYALIPITHQVSGKPVAISFSDDIGCRPECPVSLQFAENESRCVVLGSVTNGPSGEYEVLNWEQTGALAAHADWSVSPPSQTIASGKEVRLRIQQMTRDDDESGPTAGSSLANESALYPLRFTIVLRGEGANGLPKRAVYVVCTRKQ